MKPVGRVVSPVPAPSPPTRFWLLRSADPTGVSGEGYVANGVVFTDGHGSFRWCCPHQPPTTVIFDHWTHIEPNHGHGGKTRIVWIDAPPPDAPSSGPHARPAGTAIVRLGAA